MLLPLRDAAAGALLLRSRRYHALMPHFIICYAIVYAI